MSAPKASARSNSPGFIDVEDDQGMQIAVAGMKHIAEAQPICSRQLGHALQHLRQRMARNGAVHADHVGRQPAHGGKGRLAARPDAGALLLVGGFHRRAAALARRCSAMRAMASATSASTPSASMIRMAFGAGG